MNFQVCIYNSKLPPVLQFISMCMFTVFYVWSMLDHHPCPVVVAINSGVDRMSPYMENWWYIHQKVNLFLMKVENQFKSLQNFSSALGRHAPKLLITPKCVPIS